MQDYRHFHFRVHYPGGLLGHYTGRTRGPLNRLDDHWYSHAGRCRHLDRLRRLGRSCRRNFAAHNVDISKSETNHGQRRNAYRDAADSHGWDRSEAGKQGRPRSQIGVLPINAIEVLFQTLPRLRRRRQIRHQRVLPVSHKSRDGRLQVFDLSPAAPAFLEMFSHPADAAAFQFIVGVAHQLVVFRMRRIKFATAHTRFSSIAKWPGEGIRRQLKCLRR